MTTKEQAKNALDTRVRPLAELVARLIRPIPQKLIDTKTDASKADYINVTTMKDLLDAACGFFNWRAEIARVDTPGNHLGMIVRLYVRALDEGGKPAWFWQDGTGHEVTDKKIFGDPWTNAYAQGLRRAAESFGMARELWRRETVTSQGLALALIKQGVFDGQAPSVDELPKAPTDDEQAEVGRGAQAAEPEPVFDITDPRNGPDDLDVRSAPPSFDEQAEAAAAEAAAAVEPPKQADLKNAALRIVTAGGVKKEGQAYAVKDGGFDYTVARGGDGHVACDCETYERWWQVVEKFACPHIRAVKLYVASTSAPAEHETRWACSVENQRRVVELAREIETTKPPKGSVIPHLTFDQSMSALKSQFTIKSLSELTDTHAAMAINALNSHLGKLKGGSRSATSAPAAPEAASKSSSKTSPSAPKPTPSAAGAKPAPASTKTSGGRRASAR